MDRSPSAFLGETTARARGVSASDAAACAAEVLGDHTLGLAGRSGAPDRNYDAHEAVGTGLGAALSSFCFFASGALIPVLPYLFGLQGSTALVVATVLVGIALLVTGATVGLLSGGPPLRHPKSCDERDFHR